MKCNIKNHGKGFLYIKRELRQILTEHNLTGLTNARTVVVYNESIPMTSVEKSLELMLEDIRFKIEEERREYAAYSRVKEKTAKQLYESHDLENDQGTAKLVKRKIVA